MTLGMKAKEALIDVIVEERCYDRAVIAERLREDREAIEVSYQVRVKPSLEELKVLDDKMKVIRSGIVELENERDIILKDKKLIHFSPNVCSTNLHADLHVHDIETLKLKREVLEL